MLSAHLYHISDNTLKSLGRDEFLTCAPTREQIERKRDDNNNGFSSLRSGDPQCRADEFLWVDVVAPDESDYQLLAERFNLHRMILEDMKAREDRPKLHDYDDYFYLIFHAIEFENQTLKLHEIDCLVGTDYVVTLHDAPLQPLEDLRQRWTAHPQLIHSGPAYLLYELMDEVLDDYFPALDALDEKIDEIETLLFNPQQSAASTITADIFALKRDLLQVRRVAGPTRDVVNVLLRRDAESGGKHFAYFQDLYDHAVRIVDMIDTFRDVLSGALDAYLAVQSNRLNEVMKTMTAASIMLLVPALIAGIYGMNFENMPELKTRHGYFFALGAMLACVIGLYAVFRRKGWL